MYWRAIVISRTPHSSRIHSSATPFNESAFVLSLALTILLSPSRLNLRITLAERPLCAVVGLSGVASIGRGAVVFAVVELCTELFITWLNLPEDDVPSSEGADTDVPFALGTLVVEFLRKLKLRSERGLERGSGGSPSEVWLVPLVRVGVTDDGLPAEGGEVKRWCWSGVGFGARSANSGAKLSRRCSDRKARV